MSTGGKDDLESDMYLGDVIDNDDLELVAVRLEELAEVLRLALRAHSTAYCEALLEVGLHDPNGDITVRSGDKDLARVDSRHCRLCKSG